MTSRNEFGTIPAAAAINLVDVLKGVARRKVLVLGTGLLAFAIGMGLINVLKPVYTGKAQVLIQNLETPFDRMQQTDNQRPDPIDDRVIASQISVIKSEDLGRRVIAALGLENQPEFNPLIKGQGTLSKLKIKLGFGTDPALKTPEQRALDTYQDKLNVYQQPESNVVTIEYTSSNPEITAQIANTLADTYVMWTRESQSQPTERARDWLSQQIESLRKKLALSEEAVEKFRSQAGLLKGQTATLGEQEISELNSQITVAKGARLEAQARADSIRNVLESRGSVDAATDVLNSSTVQRLKEQRTEAARRMSELSVTYLSNHPKMIAVQNEIANIDKQIRAEALKIVASLNEQVRVAEAREKSLVASLDALKSQESTANLDDVKLKALEREATADRALLEAMMGRYAEASARQDTTAQPGLGVVIQNASVPTAPSFPRTGPTVLLITVAGFALGLSLAFLLELMAAASRATMEPEYRRREPEFEPAPQATMAPMPPPPPVHVPEPVVQAAAPQPPVSAGPAAWVPPPIFATVQHLTVWPHLQPQADLPAVLEMPDVNAAARTMSRWAFDIRRDLDVRRIGITSLGGGTADASVAALALARAIAISGKRTILVDLVRSNSVIGTLSGAPTGPGVADLVSGAADFTKVISRDTRSPVHVLRYGLDHSPRTQTLLLERIESVMTALSQAYEHAVVNLGEAAEDTPIYLHKCQGALLMAPASRLSEVTAAVQTLLDTGLAAAQHVLIGNSQSTPEAQARSPEAVNA